MIFRLAVPCDSVALKTLNDLFNGEGCNTASAIAESLAVNEQEIVCVAEDNGKLTGFCCGQVIKSMCYDEIVGELTELFVLEEYRRLGAGKGLVRLMESEFSKRGIKEIRLLTGEHNEKAQAFYKAVGYSEDSEVLFVKACSIKHKRSKND